MERRKLRTIQENEKRLKKWFEEKEIHSQHMNSRQPQRRKAKHSGTKEILKTITEENVSGIKIDFYSKEYYSTGEIYLENHHLCMYSPVK